LIILCVVFFTVTFLIVYFLGFLILKAAKFLSGYKQSMEDVNRILSERGYLKPTESEWESFINSVIKKYKEMPK
jgi:hypothetical protein